MDNLVGVLVSLLPFIALIALGGVIKQLASNDSKTGPDWKTLDWLCYWILNPALLFTSAAQKPLDFQSVISNGGWIWALMMLGLLLGSLGFWVKRLSALEFAARWQTAWRFNSVIGLAATSLISDGVVQVMAIFIGASVPLANLLAVTVLAMSSGQQNPGWVRRCMKSVLLNPFFLASGTGLLFALNFADQLWVIDNQSFKVVFIILELLADSAIPISLIAVGTAVIWKDLRQFDKIGAYLHFIKLFALPASAFVACKIFEIPNTTAIAFVVFAALPTSTSSHILGAAYGAKREPTALIVSQSTVFSCLTLPIWMSLATMI